jgi:hypothetical protein
MVMVIGPTPPGTGVIAEATWLTGREVDVAAELAIGQAIDADVDDHRAGLDHLGGDEAAHLPSAATRMSARRVWKARSRVCEWQMVTVAPACISSIAIGLPTMFERPMTTASLPLRSMPASAKNFITPYGVHGMKRGLPCIRAPKFSAWKAVDVLFRRDGLEYRVAVKVFRQGQLNEDAVDLGVGIEFGDLLEHDCGLTSAG